MAFSNEEGITFRSAVNVILGTAVVDPGSAGDNDGVAAAHASVDVPVVGAALGDIVLVGPGVDTVDTTVTASVTAADVVTVVVNNPTIDAVDLASSTWNFMVLQPGRLFASL